MNTNEQPADQTSGAQDKSLSVRKPYPVHLLLFAIFPVLFVFTENMTYFSLGVIFLPMAALAALALLPWGLMTLVFKDAKKSGLLLSLGLFLLFSYKVFLHQLYGFNVTVGPLTIGRFKLLLMLYAALCGGAALLLFKTRRNLSALTKIVNIMAICLVGMCVLRIVIFQFQAAFLHGPGAEVEEAAGDGTITQQAGDRPDIYYIILDGYARSDVLAELYDVDNSDFLDYLRGKGFYVAERSRSNYAQTALSFSSSLNMDYVPNLISGHDAESTDRRPLNKLCKQSSVSKLLKERGYTTVAFGSTIPFTQMKGADIFIARGWSLNQLQNAVVDLTPIPRLIVKLFPGNVFYRNWRLYPIEHLTETREFGEPLFVFAHLLCPHPPFSFDQNGNPPEDQALTLEIGDGSHLIKPGLLTRKQYVKGYRDQLIYLNKKMKETIDDLLSDPTYKPVIIIQADHGQGSKADWEDPANTDFKERLSILNAYYFPDKDYDTLYPSITPVNSFRVVFNKYFGTGHNLLEDESYFSTWSHPYKYYKNQNP